MGSDEMSQAAEHLLYTQWTGGLEPVTAHQDETISLR